MPDYEKLSKEDQLNFCYAMGDAIMKDYEERAKIIEANKPLFCSEGHDQKEWDCQEGKDGNHYHIKKFNW